MLLVYNSKCSKSQHYTCARLLVIVSTTLFPVGVTELVKQSSFNHLLLPLNGHSTCAKLLEVFFVLGIELNTLDV